MNRRYSRQMQLPEVGITGQKKLQEAKVLVVGAGGLGGPVLQYLVVAGVGTIGICDNDKVDETNLHRQILFTEHDIGKLKAVAGRDNLLKLNSSCIIKPYTKRLNYKNINEIVSSFDIIVDCTDNFATKFLIHDTCYLLKKKLVQASIYQFEGQLQCFDFNKENPCMRCLWPEVPEAACVENCQEAGVLGIVPGVLGTLQCNEVLKMILALESLPQGKTLTLNLRTLSQRQMSWKKSESCPLCSDKANIKVASDSFKLADFEILENNEEYESIDVRDNKNFDTDQLDENKNYLFYCKRGLTSYHYVKDLREKGYSNTYSLYGGVDGQ